MPKRSPTSDLRSERRRYGKALRLKVPRASHGTWRPPTDRPPVVEMLRSANRDLSPGLLRIRYARMSASPFTFLRGAASVMAHDLAGTPTTGVGVQMAGDAHVGNFGLFATPEREVVFDVNDFDETLPGPWEWDLKRLVASLAVAARYHGLPRREVRRTVRVAAQSYRQHMQAYARARYLDTWYVHLDLSTVARQVEKLGQRLFGEEVARARAKTQFHAFPHLVTSGGGRHRIRGHPPLIRRYRDPGEERAVREAFERYQAGLPPERARLLGRYHLEDVTEKVVGVGSVGTRCAVGLYLGDRDVLDPLFLQLKEARRSVYETRPGSRRTGAHAERVVTGQRMIQEASDLFLGFSAVGGRSYYVRQLRDMKFASEVTTLTPKLRFGLADLSGATLARAHARTGDPAMIAGYLGTSAAFDEALVRFALQYARQTEKDFGGFQDAVKRGRLPTS
jgi:uncharacterized protein (DUF2252 family)